MKKIIIVIMVISFLNACKKEGPKVNDPDAAFERTTETKDTLAGPPKVYTSKGCPNFEGAEKYLSVETYLPDPDEDSLSYEYYEFYNISNNQYFAVLGVLRVTGVGAQNTDLTQVNKNNKYRSVNGGNLIHLNSLDSTQADRDFSTAKNGDSIIFICFHDDNFSVRKEAVLKHYHDSLPNILPYPKSKEIRKSKKTKKLQKDLPEPSVGNGGILTCN